MSGDYEVRENKERQWAVWDVQHRIFVTRGRPVRTLADDDLRMLTDIESSIFRDGAS